MSKNADKAIKDNLAKIDYSSKSVRQEAFRAECKRLGLSPKEASKKKVSNILCNKAYYMLTIQQTQSVYKIKVLKVVFFAPYRWLKYPLNSTGRCNRLGKSFCRRLVV